MLYQIFLLYGSDPLRVRSGCPETSCIEQIQQNRLFDLTLRLSPSGQRRFDLIRREGSLLEAQPGLLEVSLPMVSFAEQVLYIAPGEDKLLALLDLDKNGLLEMTVRALVFFSNYGCTESMKTLLMYFTSRYNKFFTISRELYEYISQLRSSIKSREDRKKEDIEQVVRLENLSLGGREYLKFILLERGCKISDQNMLRTYETLSMPLREAVKDPQRFYSVFGQYDIKKPERSVEFVLTRAVTATGRSLSGWFDNFMPQWCGYQQVVTTETGGA